jgi:tRNA-2-methylthio-N6-dimethylallyladenosine synthase
MHLTEKIIDESKQGEAFAPVDNHNVYAKKFYIESYGCAMNFNDSEIIASILYEEGYGATKNIEEAELVLLNTCSIRDKAEQTVRNRLNHIRGLKKHRKKMLVGVLGCMAERLKAKLLEEEKLVDLVVGPDAYRSLPLLIQDAQGGQKGINVLLSREETYADINPVRLDTNGVSGFVSIMRGCNNMCTFCVVPFTRGRERSRDHKSIIAETQDLYNRGYKEVTLLGQNVDSYHYLDAESGEEITFAALLELVAKVAPEMRVRFSTSHPKDITDEVLYTIAKYKNICNYIHLPVQSGSTRILQLMNRTYTREWYLRKIDRIREIIPGCSISTDVITGFCTETEEDHLDTMSIMEYCQYDLAYMYYYSERPGTLAERRFEDDIPEEVKKRRLAEVVALHREHTLKNNKKEIGQIHEVLVEGPSKKNPEEYCGRTDTNKMVIFPKGDLKIGDFTLVKIAEANGATLFGSQVEAKTRAI